MNTKKMLSLLMLCMLTLGLFAQKQNVRDYVSVRFTPSHADWVYRCGEKVEIDVAAIRHYMPIANADLRYTWGPEMRPVDLDKTVNAGKTGIVSLKLDGSKEPGFKTLTVYVTVDDHEYMNYINLAFEPENIQPTTLLPKDFLRFWENTIEKAREVPLNPVFTLHPELGNAFCDVYEVRFQNMQKGQYLYGALTVPKGVNPTDTVATRKYPAVILWPGAGVKPHPGIRSFFPEHGVIGLEMGINGIPVMMQQQVYDDLRANAMHDYNTIHQDDREQYYYRKVYAGTVKTVDFLCSLPCVDAERIGCYGGSQGGALTIVNAGLDKRIKAAAANYPALAELAGYVHGRVGGWPRFFRDRPAADPKRQVQRADAVDAVVQQKVKAGEYFDVVNFAKQITCPVWMLIGYNDQVCCPTSTYSVYNSITAPKQLTTPLDCAHWAYPEHNDARAQWLLEQLLK